MDKVSSTTFQRTLLEDGIALMPQLLSPDLMDRLRACFEWGVSNPGPISVNTKGEGNPDVDWRDFGNPKSQDAYRRIVPATPFAKLLKEVWQSEHIWYHTEEPFLKKGKSGRTAWHQDLPYVPWRGEHWVNCWISFDSLPKSYSIEVIRGSHRGPIYEDRSGIYTDEPGEATYGEQSDAPSLPDIEAERIRNPSTWDVVSFDVVPGDVVFVHPGALHSGPPTDERVPLRRTLVLRFFGDKAYWSGLSNNKFLTEEQNRIVYGSSWGKPGEPYRSDEFLQLY